MHPSLPSRTMCTTQTGWSQPWNAERLKIIQQQAGHSWRRPRPLITSRHRRPARRGGPPRAAALRRGGAMTAVGPLTLRRGEDRATDRLAAAIDYRLLAAAGWDPATRALAPDRDHPLLGCRVCRVAGCELEAPGPSGLCSGCRGVSPRLAGPASRPSASPARAVRTAPVTGCAWSAGLPASSGRSGPATCAPAAAPTRSERGRLRARRHRSFPRQPPAGPGHLHGGVLPAPGRPSGDRVVRSPRLGRAARAGHLSPDRLTVA